VNRLSNPARRRRRVAVDAALVFIIVLLMTQMWLLTATLESYLAGHTGPVLPAMLLSGLLLLVSAGLYRMVVRLDRLPERASESPGSGPWQIG
jgi:hypothetical protein